MDRTTSQPLALPAGSATMEVIEDLHAEADEPPDERSMLSQWTPFKSQPYSKGDSAIFNRRESLLTRQLHIETEQTDEETDMIAQAPPRALSTQSTWSNPSVASTAELTSDDGHSVASPAISPPLLPTALHTALLITEKPLTVEPQILGHEEKSAVATSEQSVEAGLGRKRCISFACGNKGKTSQTSQPNAMPVRADLKQAEPLVSASPPKRKCTIKFACPARTGTEGKSTERPGAGPQRPNSPAPPQSITFPEREASKAHRGSDSTVTHASPKSVRKTSEAVTTTATPLTGHVPLTNSRKLSNSSDASTEATRFHEFASSEDEPEEWVQESTCYKSRLTVTDTLRKENIIRKACEEAEEEVVEEEEFEAEIEDDVEQDDEDDEDQNIEDDEEDVDGEDDDESDEGFRTDDEEGFAESDTEDEESDEDWWRPGGASTAATSVDHLERLAFTKNEDNVVASSVGSVSSGQTMHKVKAKMIRKRRGRQGPTMNGRSDAVDLPDSTDFVCGTLDEDRPLEQAYLNHLKAKEASKHKVRPQDIDPTFPTSDPEMDEEDDEDLEDPEESDKENLMHGDLEEMDGDYTARPGRPRTRSNAHRSPPPKIRYRSPAPGLMKRQTTARSPPPTAKRSAARSPPPPVRRSTARSPPPRKLFGQSPKRLKSPAPLRRTTSPPNTRRASPIMQVSRAAPHVLASRPIVAGELAASMPRGGYLFGKRNDLSIHDEGSDVERKVTLGKDSRRGAIEIFRSLEKKRERRHEKEYLKLNTKAGAKGSRPGKIKPGKGAERMREIGLQLQEYRGKGKHILSL